MTYILATCMHAPTLEITYSFLVSFDTSDLWILRWTMVVALMRSIFAILLLLLGFFVLYMDNSQKICRHFLKKK
jgi:hypothetical protein